MDIGTRGLISLEAADADSVSDGVPVAIVNRLEY